MALVENAHQVPENAGTAPRFDVFVSFKNLDGEGCETRDRAIAEKVTHALAKKGLSVFFSIESLERLGASAYKKAIDRALDEARVLVAVGTTRAHLESEWVRYEWDGFLQDIMGGVKPTGHVFVVVEGLRPRDFPRGLRHCQTFAFTESELQRLYNFIRHSMEVPASGQRQPGEPAATHQIGTAVSAVHAASQSVVPPKRKSRGFKPTRSITHGSFLWTMEFSPDGTILATAGGDGTVRFWNPDDGETRDVVLELDGEHPAIAFHPSARRFATSANPKSPGDNSQTESSAPEVAVCVWDNTKGSAVSRQTLVDHEGGVEHLHFSASGKRLVCVGSMKSGAAQIWNISSDCKTMVPHFTLHHRLIIDAFFSVDDEYVASIGSDNSVRLWQTSDGAEYLRLYHDDEVIAGCFAPSADLILSGSKDKTARLWDLPTGQQLALFNHDQMLSQVAFSPDGTRLVTAADEARVWHVLTHTLLHTLRHDSDGVLCVAFTPDGRLVITGGCDDTVRLWRATDGCEVARLYHEAYAGEISTIRVSPDGLWLATVADQWSGKVLLWELANLG